MIQSVKCSFVKFPTKKVLDTGNCETCLELKTSTLEIKENLRYTRIEHNPSNNSPKHFFFNLLKPEPLEN